jgi:hypothetical protein
LCGFLNPSFNHNILWVFTDGTSQGFAAHLDTTVTVKIKLHNRQLSDAALVFVPTVKHFQNRFEDLARIDMHPLHSLYIDSLESQRRHNILRNVYAYVVPSRS